MGRGDPESGTRWPQRKNGTSHPGRNDLVGDGFGTSSPGTRTNFIDHCPRWCQKKEILVFGICKLSTKSKNLCILQSSMLLGIEANVTFAINHEI